MENQLEELQRKLRINYIPVVAIFVSLGSVGFIGNATAIFFYCLKTKRKSSTIVFMTYLAISDLGVSVSTGLALMDLFFNVSFENETVCKTITFIMRFLLIFSALVLWMISVDRYWKICKPHGTQLNERKAKICIFILFIFSVLFSAKYCFAYEIVIREITFENTTVNSSSCTRTERMDKQTLVNVFNIIDIIFVILVVGTFVYTYGNISKFLKMHHKTLQKNCKGSHQLGRFSHPNSNGIELGIITGKNKEGLVSQNGIESDCNINFEENSEHTSGDDSLASVENKKVADIAEANPSSNPTILNVPHKEVKRSGSTNRQVTTMMIVLSVGLCICFMPYIIWSAIIGVYSEARKLALTSAVVFIKRTPFLNAVLNPFVLCFYNPEYRNYMSGLFGNK